MDNLGGEVEVDRDAFAQRVAARAQRYLAEGLPQRANAFYLALARYYQQGDTLEQAIAAGRALLAATEVSA